MNQPYNQQTSQEDETSIHGLADLTLRDDASIIGGASAKLFLYCCPGQH